MSIFDVALFMVMDTVDEFDFERDMARLAYCPGRRSGKLTWPGSRAALPELLL